MPNSNVIPKDILNRLQRDFKNAQHLKEAINLVIKIKESNLNVGWIQLSRAIIIIANGDLGEMKSIIDSNFYGDPRDVIMGMMAIKGSANHYGMTEFED